jgi:hypothetical protein
MPDTYGAETLPVTAPGATATVSDRALDVLGAWMYAVINAECSAAWTAVAAGEPILRGYQTQDPGGQDFNENLLPHLFLFRAQANPAHFEDGNWGTDSTVTMLFVFPPAEQSKAARRMAIFNGLQKAVHRALGPRNGRHPSWVVAGDTDPDAAVWGSSILTHAGLVWCESNPWNIAEVRIPPMLDAYDAIKADFRIREYYVDDPTLDQTELLTTISAMGGYQSTQQSQ